MVGRRYRVKMNLHDLKVNDVVEYRYFETARYDDAKRFFFVSQLRRQEIAAVVNDNVKDVFSWADYLEEVP